MPTRARLSTFIVFAATFGGCLSAAAYDISVDCNYTKNKKTAFCLTNNDGTESLWRCDKKRNGTWKCGEVAVGRMSQDLEPGLKDAVIKSVERSSSPAAKKQ
jgi:hypothetical protein